MTQCERVLQYMDDFGEISTLQAFYDLGITRLASRIHDLRCSGIQIEKRMAKRRNRYGEYCHFAIYRRV